MPRIFTYECNSCDFAMKEGWGYQFYVTNEEDERMICFHPGERAGVEEVLGKDSDLWLVLSRTGFVSDCICLDCLHYFGADFGSTEEYWHPYQVYLGFHVFLLTKARDKRECPECGSPRVKTQLEMVGQTCPKCGEGIIEENWTGAIS